ENFPRTKDEVENIMNIIEKEALELYNDKRLHKNRVHVKAIGRVDLLPQSLRETLKKVEESTKDYEDHYLNIAIAYGGRAEIIDATKKIAEDIKNNKLNPKDITEELFMKYLYTAHLPNPYPDLIIRTSGEERLSGFLLWQSAYSELCFLDVYWPDFRKIDLLRAIRTYQRRKRRFGR
ncbi:MAG: polyprenyl diphosphate synthase, partial [Candidatus Bathyarchaeia archaeon]